MKKKRRTKKKESAILPEELLIVILLRFPVKTLIRFRCVSKSWYSLISDPEFGKLHFDFTASTQKLFFFPKGALKMLSVDFSAPSLHDDSVTSVVKLNFPLPKVKNPFSPVEIAGSCRGFMLFHCYPNLYLWNPCTSSHRQIAYPPSNHAPQLRSSPFFQGFGYDASTDDYLIMLAFSGERRDSVEIFSLRANTWRQMEGDQLEFLGANDYVFKGGDVGLFFKGTIHWIGYRQLTDFEGGGDIGEIIAFDLKERVFFDIALPNIDSYNPGELRVFGRCLGVCTRNESAYDIWMMEEYKVQASWTRIRVVANGISTGYLSPICRTLSGDIVGTNGCKELVKFNDKGKVLESRNFNEENAQKCPFLDFSKKWAVVLHTETLLSLPRDS